MKAAVFRAGRLIVDQIAEPTPQQGQVLVKTLACGICGSDLHFRRHAQQFVDTAARAGPAFTMDLTRDIVMGHEFCGELIDYGPGTQRRFSPGVRVCSVPSSFVDGAWRTVGQSNEAPGGFGEYMALTESLLLEAPNGLSAAHAALTEPMAVGWHATAIANLTPEHVPLVIGCGPVGLAVIAALKMSDVRPIVATDFSPARRRLAEQMGADIVVNTAERSPYECWAQVAALETANAGLDLQLPRAIQCRPCAIFECVGTPGMIRQVMEGAPRGARIIIVGACMELDFIDPMIGIYKELSLQFSLAYSGSEFARVLAFLGNGDIDVAPLVTGQVGVDDVPSAFDALANPEAHAKIIVEPWR